MLSDSPPLVETYDLVMLDLDGVVYVGPDAVPGAADHLAAARDAGARLAFVTNNASRPASVVAERLTGLGVPAEVDDVAARTAQLGGHVVKPPCPTYYGQWQAVLSDPERHVFRVSTTTLPEPPAS